MEASQCQQTQRGEVRLRQVLASSTTQILTKLELQENVTFGTKAQLISTVLLYHHVFGKQLSLTKAIRSLLATELRVLSKMAYITVILRQSDRSGTWEG